MKCYFEIILFRNLCHSYSSNTIITFINILWTLPLQKCTPSDTRMYIIGGMEINEQCVSLLLFSKLPQTYVVLFKWIRYCMH